MKKFLLLLLLLIAIALLAYYCTYRMNTATIIQNDIHTRAQAALDEKNMGWANLVVDGRDITLTGSAPNKEAKKIAEHVAGVTGYNHINNQLSIAGEAVSDPANQDSIQNNTPQQSEEQLPTGADNKIVGDDDIQQTNTTPAKNPPINQDDKQVIDGIEKTPIKQVEASKNCQRKFNKILKTPIYFKTSSTSVQRKSITVLDKLALAAKQCGSFNLVVHGHTDSTGRASLNKTLSHGRAQAIMKYLISKKIDSKRLTAQGHGSRKPIASNKTGVGRARNRRIEITIEDKH